MSFLTTLIAFCVVFYAAATIAECSVIRAKRLSVQAGGGATAIGTSLSDLKSLSAAQSNPGGRVQASLSSSNQAQTGGKGSSKVTADSWGSVQDRNRFQGLSASGTGVATGDSTNIGTDTQVSLINGLASGLSAGKGAASGQGASGLALGNLVGTLWTTGGRSADSQVAGVANGDTSSVSGANNVAVDGRDTSAAGAVTAVGVGQGGASAATKANAGVDSSNGNSASAVSQGTSNCVGSTCIAGSLSGAIATNQGVAASAQNTAQASGKGAASVGTSSQIQTAQRGKRDTAALGQICVNGVCHSVIDTAGSAAAFGSLTNAGVKTQSFISPGTGAEGSATSQAVAAGPGLTGSKITSSLLAIDPFEGLTRLDTSGTAQSFGDNSFSSSLGTVQTVNGKAQSSASSVASASGSGLSQASSGATSSQVKSS